MTKLIKIFFLFTIFLFPLKAFALTVSPATLEIISTKNQAQINTVKIYNEGRKKYKIVCYLSDVTFDEKGKKTFLNSGIVKNSITKYIKLSENSFVLEAGESKEVFLNTNIPDSIKGGNTAILFFQSFPPSEENNSNNKRIITSVRVGATILQENPESIYVKSRVDKISLKKTKSSKLFIDLDILNESNTHIFASGYVAFLGEAQNFLGSVKLTKTLVTANNKGKLKGEFKFPIEKGKYQALITYSYRDKNFSIIKPFEIDEKGDLLTN